MRERESIRPSGWYLPKSVPLPYSEEWPHSTKAHCHSHRTERETETQKRET